MEECAAFSSSKKTISRRALLFVLGVWCVRSCTNQIHQGQGPACRRMRLRRAAAMTVDWDSDSTKEARKEGSAAADPLRLRFRFFLEADCQCKRRFTAVTWGKPSDYFWRVCLPSMTRVMGSEPEAISNL